MSKTQGENKNAKEIIPKKKANEIFANVADKASRAGEKGAEIASNVISQTVSGSKALASGLAKGAKDLSDKAKVDSYNKRMKKYNPLFPEEYFSEEFFLPNIIRIVDDAVRRDIDVCKGAIGWRENRKGAEVLFLYDEFVDQCGLCFVPKASCDDIYYVDSFDRKRFIKLDCIFQQAHEERLAELEHIAYSLGAKSCNIIIEEKEFTHDKKKRAVGGHENKGIASVTENYEAEATSDSKVRRSGRSETKFKGNDMVVVPELKWFAHDNNILNLIEYRCKGGNAITSKTLELSGSSSATMSKTAAGSIDVAVADMGISQSYSMEDHSVKESASKIIYQLEF